MAFVPPGMAVLESRLGGFVVCANDRALLVDRFEVTRGAFRAWGEQPGRSLDPELQAWIARWTREEDDWPASFMTRDEARAFAASRGMRLPTAREWLRIACGTRSLPWPWGQGQASSVANTLELGLKRPAPVGSFEQGRSPLGTHDMIGNVWEWVDAAIAPPAALDEASLAWAMGGSYLSRLRRLHEEDSEYRLSLHHQDLDPSTRSSDVGLRCAADAEEWLAAHAGAWSASEGSRARLLAVGESWGRDAIPVLEALAARKPAPRALAWLLEGARR